MISYKYRLYFCFFLCCFIYTACSDHIQKEQLGLILSDSLALPLGNYDKTNTKALFYHEESGRRFMAYDDELSDTIRVFDLDSKKKVYNIPIPVYVGDRIVNRFGFYLKSLDSIYIPVDGYQIFLINKDGKLLKKIDYAALQEKYLRLNNVLSLSRFSKSAMATTNGIVFIQHDNRYNYEFPDIIRPSDYRFCFFYNETNDKISLKEISLPDNFWENGVREMSISVAYDNNRFIYAPQFSHDIYTSYDNKGIFRHYFTQSRYIDSLYQSNPIEDNLTREEYRYRLCKYQYYIGLLWDKYRNVYYRFFWPGLENANIKNQELIARSFNNFPNFGIMVLDYEFNIVDEVVLPKHIYSWDKSFVAKEGLYISADNPDKVSLGRNEWIFHIYRLDSTNRL